jgi:hypothetical protein
VRSRHGCKQTHSSGKSIEVAVLQDMEHNPPDGQ